jgi:hypothetical protein
MSAHLVFSSGMSRRPDFEPALAVGHSIGVDINEMSQNACNALAAALVKSDAHVFVDSGAFAAFRAGLRGKPARVDFAKVFDGYHKLALAVCLADGGGDDAASRLHFVLPDVVGDQVASLAMLREFQDEAGAYASDSILPVQGGAMSLVAFYDAACEILGRTSLRIGVPSAEAAVDNAELAELLATRDDIFGVHILGAASELKAGPRLAVLRAVNYDGSVSLDANRLRSFWNSRTTRNEARHRLLAGLGPKRADDAGPLFAVAA